MKSFIQFVSESVTKEVVFTFGKFNPPTIESEDLIENVAKIANGKTYRIYTSHVDDQKNNPLKLEEKVKWMRKMSPKYARNIMSDDVDGPLAICTKLFEQGFTGATMVAPADRVVEYQALLDSYNGFAFTFKGGVKVVAATECNNILSESKLRAAAIANDLETFSKGLPADFAECEDYFNAVRNGLGLKESRNFRKHIQLESVGDRREAYVSGELFEIGDDVVIKESEEVGKITHCGSNYLIVELTDGKKVRKWLNAVEPVEKKVIIQEDQKLEEKAFPIYQPKIRVPSSEGIPLSKFRKQS
jgi:hypothetical protein